MIRFLFVLLFMIPSFAQADDLKLLSWNVFMLPKPVNFTKQSARAKIIAEQLKDAPHDIILFQEAFTSDFRKRVGNALKISHPYQKKLNRSVRLFHFLNSGLFVVSRHPFKVLGHHYFNRCTHADCFAAKGVILLELTHTHGKKLQIAVTHTQAWDDNLAREIRLFQLDEINELLKKHARPGIPQILAGDLNIDSRSDDFKRLEEIFELSNVGLSGEINYSSGFAIDCYKKPGENNPHWIDHILLRSQGSNAQIKDKRIRPFIGLIKGKACPLSDHHGVEAVINF